MNKELISILVCPSCLGTLIYQKQNEELICPFDNIGFKIEGHIANMLLTQARQLSTDEKDAIRAQRKAKQRGRDEF